MRRARVPANMPKPAIKKALRRTLLAILAALVAAELSLRAAGFEYAGRDDPVAIWNSDEDRDLRLGRGLHRVAAGQLWEPRPGALIPERWTGAPERVNASGYRGPDRPSAKTAGVLRIATLGDSSTFGYGVPYAETYSAGLEVRLAEAGVRAEVLDFGVVGYSLLQGIERYRRRVREYRPDVVVAAFGSINDHHVAQGLPDREKIARAVEGESALFVFLQRARQHLRLLQWIARRRDGDQDPAARELESRRALELNERLPFLGRTDFETAHGGSRRVPLPEFEAGLDELARLVAADGAQLVLVAMPHRPGVEGASPVLRQYAGLVNACSQRTGCALYDARTDFRIYREIERGDPTLLFLDGDEVHPSRRGHARMAKSLAAIVAEPRAGH